MPATRQSKRKSTKKAKAEAAPVEEARVEEPSAQEEEEPRSPQREDASMNVDSNPEVVQPEESSSKGVEGPSIAEKVGETVEEAMDVVELGVKKVAGKAGEVIAAAGEFVDDMNGVEESSGSRSKEDSRSQSAEVEEEDGSKQKLSLDERRAKMEALRKKMVCFIY